MTLEYFSKRFNCSELAVKLCALSLIERGKIKDSDCSIELRESMSGFYNWLNSVPEEYRKKLAWELLSSDKIGSQS